MITCVVDYVIDPKKIDVFEQFAKRWIDLVNRYGGRHHGYFLPSEGASDRALALFSFSKPGGLRNLSTPLWRQQGVYRGRSHSR